MVAAAWSRNCWQAGSLVADASVRTATVDVFGEDAAHARVLEYLVGRIGDDEGIGITVRVRAAQGGQARAFRQYEAYQSALETALSPPDAADLIVVAIDGNCTRFAEMRNRIVDKTRITLRHLLVAACPDPHVERWMMADPHAFHAVVGAEPATISSKCERGYYKKLLGDAIRAAGYPATLGGLEFLPEIVRKMDLFRAGKNDPSLKAFVGDLRRRLRETSRLD